MIATHPAPTLTAAEMDPDGRAAHACGRALESVPMSVRTGFKVGEPLTVGQALFLLREGSRVFARLQLVEDRSAPRLTLLDREAVKFILNTEGDHNDATRFHLDQDGDLILMP
jgi:hypothetical protein